MELENIRFGNMHLENKLQREDVMGKYCINA
jgi:hypothetical protein